MVFVQYDFAYCTRIYRASTRGSIVYSTREGFFSLEALTTESYISKTVGILKPFFIEIELNATVVGNPHHRSSSVRSNELIIQSPQQQQPRLDIKKESGVEYINSTALLLLFSNYSFEL